MATAVIGVLADDLTGAAEIGGVAWRYGLSAEVQIAWCQSTAQVLILDTDSRSLAPSVAAESVRGAAISLRERGHLFKKVDSVLRGPVLAELIMLLQVTGRGRVLLVPSNPGRGRTIQGGRSYIHGIPINQTEFAHDPEHPILTADVRELLGNAGEWPVSVLRRGDALPSKGIIIAEASTSADLFYWAGQVDENTLPAGAAEFFAVWLMKLNASAPVMSSPTDSPQRVLIVSGSASTARHEFYRRCEAEGVPVLRMPLAVFADPLAESKAQVRWEAEIRRALKIFPQVILTIDQSVHPAPNWPKHLRLSLAAAATHVLTESPVDQLYVEGGATARALVDCLGWTRLRVFREFVPGIVAVLPYRLTTPLLILKPGSYSWPATVGNLFAELGTQPRSAM